MTMNTDVRIRMLSTLIEQLLLMMDRVILTMMYSGVLMSSLSTIIRMQRMMMDRVILTMMS